MAVLRLFDDGMLELSLNPDAIMLRNGPTLRKRNGTRGYGNVTRRTAIMRTWRGSGLEIIEFEGHLFAAERGKGF